MNDSLWVCHTDSGIEFKMNGKSATVVVSSDGVYGSSYQDTPAHILIYGDGKLLLDALTTESPMDLNVEFDKPGEHVVNLIKASECQDGSFFIDEIKTDSRDIKPTPPKSKKIEILGDSITTAVGAIVHAGEYLTTTVDGTKSYAYKVAQKFNVDYSIFAFGGFGVYGEPRTVNKLLIPNIYDKLGRLNWNFEHPENTTIPMSSIEWDHSEFEPDLVLINLGTNDVFYINTRSEDIQEAEKVNFTKAYKEFIAHIRSVHPNAEILCTYGLMGQTLYPQIETAVNDYIKETNDKKVNVFPLSEENIEKYGPGFYGHPSIFSHVAAANEIIDKIEELYGWIPDPNVDITETENCQVEN